MQLISEQPQTTLLLVARSGKRLFSEQLRAAVDTSGHSRLAVGRGSGIDKAALSRFMGRKVGLSLASIDELVRFLDLELVSRRLKGRKVR